MLGKKKHPHKKTRKSRASTIPILLKERSAAQEVRTSMPCKRVKSAGSEMGYMSNLLNVDTRGFMYHEKKDNETDIDFYNIDLLAKFFIYRRQ